MRLLNIIKLHLVIMLSILVPTLSSKYSPTILNNYLFKLKIRLLMRSCVFRCLKKLETNRQKYQLLNQFNIEDSIIEAQQECSQHCQTDKQVISIHKEEYNQYYQTKIKLHQYKNDLYTANSLYQMAQLEDDHKQTQTQLNIQQKIKLKQSKLKKQIQKTILAYLKIYKMIKQRQKNYVQSLIHHYSKNNQNSNSQTKSQTKNQKQTNLNQKHNFNILNQLKNINVKKSLSKRSCNLIKLKLIDFQKEVKQLQERHQKRVREQKLNDLQNIQKQLQIKMDQNRKEQKKQIESGNIKLLLQKMLKIVELDKKFNKNKLKLISIKDKFKKFTVRIMKKINKEYTQFSEYYKDSFNKCYFQAYKVFQKQCRNGDQNCLKQCRKHSIKQCFKQLKNLDEYKKCLFPKLEKCLEKIENEREYKKCHDKQISMCQSKTN